MQKGKPKVFNLKTLTVAAAIALSSGFAQAGQLSGDQKVLLQSAMYQYIEESLFDDVIPHVDLTTGVVTNLVPLKAHPIILSMGDNFILCADFVDPKGEEVEVDFFVKPVGDSFRVFRMDIDNREPVRKLIAEGKVKKLQ